MSTIPNGAVVRYQGVWPTVDVITLIEIGGIVSAVTQRLVRDGLLVLGEKDDLGIIAGAIGKSFNIELDLQVENGLGFGSTEDIISIIRHEVFTVTGEFPFADSIPLVPSGADPTAPAHPTPTASPGESVGQFFRNIGSGTGIGIGLVALGVVFAFLLIFRFGMPAATRAARRGGKAA